MTKKELLVTSSELAKHNTSSDAWIVIDDQVYDVGSFATRHPGGAKLLLFFKGQDASDAFHSFHAGDTARPEAIMPKLRVGTFVGDAAEQNESLPAVIADFRRLRDALQAEGLFEANIWFFALWYVCFGVASDVC